MHKLGTVIGRFQPKWFPIAKIRMMSDQLIEDHLDIMSARKDLEKLQELQRPAREKLGDVLETLIKHRYDAENTQLEVRSPNMNRTHRSRTSRRRSVR